MPTWNAIAARRGANIKLVEMPPGPPVISTITVEIYGQAAVGSNVLAIELHRTAMRTRRWTWGTVGLCDVQLTSKAGAGVVPEEVAGDQAALDRP